MGKKVHAYFIFNFSSLFFNFQLLLILKKITLGGTKSQNPSMTKKVKPLHQTNFLIIL